MKDLFDQEYTEIDLLPKPKTYIQKMISNYNYRKSINDKKCRNCISFMMKSYNKTYFKCKKLGNTNSPATDIRANHVCDVWESKE